MRRFFILWIFGFGIFLILISISVFFVSKSYLSPAFALEPTITHDQVLSDILEKNAKEGKGETSQGKKLSKKELIHKIADNFNSLSDTDKKNVLMEFDRYFDELVENADRKSWKDIGKEIQDFILDNANHQKWYAAYFAGKIGSTKDIYQRKALIMGVSQQDDGQNLTLSDYYTLQMFELYDRNLIKTLSRDEKILFFSGNFSRYDYSGYYTIDGSSTERYYIEEREHENLRRKIVNTLFSIVGKTRDYQILKVISRQLAKGNLMQTPIDFDRYISLLKGWKADEPGNMAILQKLRIARFRKDESIGSYRASIKLEKDRKGLKKEDDFDLCSNLNDRYIRRHRESWFCRGAVEYLKVRGGEYYSYRPLKYMGSEDQFNPEEEIPGWNRWLREFPDHPSADDALYRLGRCYEIEGDYDRAIGCFLDVLKSPDDYWRFDAVYRLIYILDVEMSRDDFERYLANHPDSLIYPEVLYSYGVCLMREGSYERAISIFNELRKKYSLDNNDIFIFTKFYYLRTSLGGNLKKQITDCRALARIQKQINEAKTPGQKADILYKKGQFLYYRHLTFYNHLWNGGRVLYYMYSDGIRYDMEAPMTATRIRRENLERRFYEKFYNRMQSIAAFRQIPKVYPHCPYMDKVYYSIAMEYTNFDGYEDNAYKYIDWQYGRAKYLEKLLKECPDSSLADEAVYSYPDEYWHKKYQMSREEYIVRRYPFSDLGRKLLVERNISRDSETDIIRYHIRRIISADSVKDIMLECLKSGLGIPENY